MGILRRSATVETMTVTVVPLEREHLAAAELLLADACPFDRASDVADEKLFGPGPASMPQALGVWDGSELVGVAAVAARYLRVLAVHPRARKRGIGAALLAACEARALAHALGTAAPSRVPDASVAPVGGAAPSDAGAPRPIPPPPPRLLILDQPGNYLAPGVDERNTGAIAWLERRGYRRGPELRCNVLVDVRGNPRVTPERLAQSIAAAAERGYEVRRARVDETVALRDAITKEFGGAWPFEVERALGHEPAGVHVAIKDDAYCAFAAHDGNNRGLGWFGPTGTWPAHRGQGLGEALLLACLVDVAAEHSQCEVAWIGPRPFYEKIAGIAGERRFVPMLKDLHPSRPV